jgi:hypothetical protein
VLSYRFLSKKTKFKGYKNLHFWLFLRWCFYLDAEWGAQVVGSEMTQVVGFNVSKTMKFLATMPKSGVFAFAYGSGVYQQRGQSMEVKERKPMI